MPVMKDFSSSFLSSYVADRVEAINSALAEFIADLKTGGSPVYDAIHYSLFPGGKRLRPILTLAAAEALGAAYSRAIRPACALELIHSYSLIHDDLPCMDDDDFRRGRYTVHKAFGEAMALLAGDSLISLAFEILSSPGAVAELGAETCVRLVEELARASGGLGMAGGQAMELLYTSGSGSGDGAVTEAGQGSEAVRSEKLGKIETLETVARFKTGALFKACLRCGAIAAGSNERALEALSRFAEYFGLGFQAADDLADMNSDEDSISLARAYGADRTRSLIRELRDRAVSELDFLGERARVLRSLADYLLIASA
ncbi:MAG: polyprenyl synthetase family protein [Firmicutes bacterium]|nr:polyprenyl synthetase family protein [Bacillota bacterium]